MACKMKVAFFYECGKVPEVGTGHKYRSEVLAELLSRRGHDIIWVAKNNDPPKDANVLVIDHVFTQTHLIKRAKELGLKVLLIDGAEEDVELVDASVSATYNKNAQYSGIKYMAFKPSGRDEKYREGRTEGPVFVSMGGFDANNIAETVLDILQELGLHAIVTKSINHKDLKQRFPNIEVFDGDYYYDAMRECLFGIVNGGLTLFAALNFGLPSIGISQYEHQKNNIAAVDICCYESSVNRDSIISGINQMLSSDYYRSGLSKLAQHFVDGKGAARVCKIIEDLG